MAAANPAPAPAPVDLPWVLIRKGSPPLRFRTRQLGQRFYDMLRFNRFGGGAGEDAALFGPRGEAWYCRAWRAASWQRDDERRRRDGEPPGEANPSEPAQ
jgi:hypothetical protein